MRCDILRTSVHTLSHPKERKKSLQESLSSPNKQGLLKSMAKVTFQKPYYSDTATYFE